MTCERTGGNRCAFAGSHAISEFTFFFMLLKLQEVEEPTSMSYVLPVRLYGDGADAFSPKLNKSPFKH